jgi:hypothetical protein
MSDHEAVSRRKLIAAAAVLPAATVAAAAGFGDTELLGMEPVINELWNVTLPPILDEIDRAEKAMFEWKQQNPEPQSVTPPLSEDGCKAIAEMHKALAEACEPYEAAYRIEREAWEQKEAAAEWQAAKAAADERVDAFWAKHARIVEKLSAMPAITLEGLKVKARLALMMDEKDLAWSVVEDLAAAR